MDILSNSILIALISIYSLFIYFVLQNAFTGLTSGFSVDRLLRQIQIEKGILKFIVLIAAASMI